MISPIYDSAKLPLKIFHLDRGTHGMAVCFAYTKEKAEAKFIKEFGEHLYGPICAYDLVDGLCFVHNGEDNLVLY